MTDRELLELAAKAAGYELADTKPDYPLWVEGVGLWNPLTDDGNAFRLAVRLGMIVREGQAQCGDVWCIEPPSPNSDPFAETRRAVVRAAAEMAKTLA